jgi:hypothetical protein
MDGCRMMLPIDFALIHLQTAGLQKKDYHY